MTETEKSVGREVAFRYLDFVGNHERKIGAAAVVMAQPGRAFSAADLCQAVNECQGPEPVWRLKQHMAYYYLKQGLVRGGVAVGIEQAESRVFHAEASEEQRETLHALIGFSALWSLDNPNLSVQQLLGISDGLSPVPKPRTRYRLCDLLAHGSQSMSRLQGHFRRDRYIEDQITELYHEQIVTINPDQTKPTCH